MGALLVLAAALLMAPSFRAAGSEFDEGILVAAPTRVVEGDLPYRDFETFYGPGEPYLVAGAFRVFGASLGVERAVGFVFRLLVVGALFALLRRWGTLPALAGGVIAASLVAADGVTADNDVAAQGLILLALVLLLRGPRRATVFAAGLAAGCAGLFRPELFLPAEVAALPVLLTYGRATVLRFVGASVVPLVPYLPLALAAGSDRLGRNISDLLATGRDRRLPITLASETGRLVVALAAALLLLVLAAAVELRRRDRHRAALLALVLFSLSQLSYALWRSDTRHVALGGLVAFAATPTAAALLLRRHAVPAAVTSAAVVLAVFASVTYVRGAMSRNAKLALGRVHSYAVVHEGRAFRVESRAVAANLQRVVDAEAKRARPGSRLFVGPADLRRTAGNDVFLYYLLPDQRPASFYLELDPVASRRAELADDVARADFLVLGRRWDRIHEPNATRRYGLRAANLVVRKEFCPQATFGGYTLYRRCASLG
jgi:hypothetical protein